LLGSLDAMLAAQQTTKPPHRDFRARMPLENVGYLVQAAADRNMSISAYVRRATTAFIAFDLGLDLAQLLENEPATRLRYESPEADRLERGEGHGKWVIGSLW
jgi:hypothetical protein